MTREQAASKVAKLRKLADGSPNPEEASSARRKADELAAEHGLTENDLLGDSLSGCYDELVDEMQKLGAEAGLRGTTGKAFDEIFARLKNPTPSEKVGRIRYIRDFLKGPVASALCFLPSVEVLVKSMRETVDKKLASRGIDPETMRGKGR
jgi:hypothetical protein